MPSTSDKNQAAAALLRMRTAANRKNLIDDEVPARYRVFQNKREKSIGLFYLGL